MNTAVTRAEQLLRRPLRDVRRCGLTVPDYVEDLLRAYACGTRPLETGGLLLGWWKQRVPVIVFAVEVRDPDATHNCWTRDEGRAQEALAKAQRRGHKHVGYIGDWHSHPANVGPSGSDVRELRRVSRQYDDPIALAVVRHGGPVDIRLAVAGRLTTVSRLAAGGPEGSIPSGDSS